MSGLRKGIQGWFAVTLMGVLILSALMPIAASAAAPRTISYQGYLTDASGNPTSGSPVMVFSLYTVPTGGTNVWQELQTSIVVTNGMFNVQLGSSTALPANFQFDQQYYLGVKVGSDPEMTPRQALSSVASAITAETALKLGITCTEGQVLKIVSGVWACGSDSVNTGTITGVTAGTGLSGGGSSGSVTISAVTGTTAGMLAAGDHLHDANYVKKAGDSMTGPLNVSSSSTGTVANFSNSNASNANPTLYVTANGSGSAIHGYTTGTFTAGRFIIDNPTNPYGAVYGQTNGTGPAIRGYNSGAGYGGQFMVTNPSSTAAALYVGTSGTGPAGQFIGNVEVSGTATMAGVVSGGSVTANRFSGDGSALTGISSASGLTSTGSVTISSGNLTLPSSGIIYSAGTGNLMHTTGTSNYFAGQNAGNVTLTGAQNTGIGYNALLGVTSGSNNLASGYQALFANNSGYYNTAVGSQTLRNTTSGYNNAAFGSYALYSNVTGTDNTATGYMSLYNSTAGFNTASGYQTLLNNSSGVLNTALGFMAGGNQTTGSNNIYLGANVLGAAGESNITRIGIGQTQAFIAGTLNADGLVTAGTVTAAKFSGDGSGLTGISNASTLNNQPGSYYIDTANNQTVAGSKTFSSQIVSTVTGSTPPLSVASSALVTNLNADTIDYMHASAFQQKYGKAVVVAKTGGDFIDPITAMTDVPTWCGIPSATNMCLVKIMPGVYSLSTSLTMTNYVDIEGSGENVTKLTLGSYQQQTVVGASNAELRSLTVQNPTTGATVIGIYTNGASPSIMDVTIDVINGTAMNAALYSLNTGTAPSLNNVTMTVANGSTNYGVYVYNNTGASAIRIDDTRINITGSGSAASQNFGVYNSYGTASGSVILQRTNIAVSGSNATNWGTYANGSSIIARQCRITVSGSSSTNYAADQNGTFTTSTTLMNVAASASGSGIGSANYCLHNTAGTMTVDQSTISAPSGTNNYALYSDGTSTTVTSRVGTTKLTGSSLAQNGATHIISGTYSGSDGVFSAATFSGSGALLTNLPATGVTGTVANAANASTATYATSAGNADTVDGQHAADIIAAAVPQGYLIMGETTTAPAGYTYTGQSVVSASTNYWASKANMPTTRQGLVAVTVNNKVYAIGGMGGPSFVNLSKVEAYDPTSNTWLGCADMPTARQNMAAAEVNGFIYVISGSTSTGNTAVTEVYNTAVDTWDPTKAALPTARMGAAAAAVGSKIYVMGGMSGSEDSIVYEYDTASGNTWNTKTPMPHARSYLTAVAVNNKIYAMGGSATAFNQNYNEEYNPALDQWIAKTPVPTNVSYHSAAGLSNKVYLFGGTVGPPSTTFTYEYDATNDIWNSRSSCSSSVCASNFRAAAALNGAIYVLGGMDMAIPSNMNTIFYPPVFYYLHKKN